MHPNSPIESVFRLNPLQRSGSRKLGLATLADLIRHYPSRYEEALATVAINNLVPQSKVSIIGRVVRTNISRAFYKKIPIAEVVIEDTTGRAKAVWYHQAYMAKKVLPGHLARISGTVQVRKNEIYIANPEIEEVNASEINNSVDSLFRAHEGSTSLNPVYPETRGLSSSWMRHAVQRLIKNEMHKKISDPIPRGITAKYNLPTLETALVWIHMPHNEQHAEAARKRFAFEEIFFIQLERQKLRQMYAAGKSYCIDPGETVHKEFLSTIKFPLTGAQSRAIKTIIDEMKSAKPMTRLLEGDVGSGKTVVAAAAAYTVLHHNKKGQPLQVAYMAPTEILAKQHFESFIHHLRNTGIAIGLILGSECRKFPSKINKGKHTHISKSQLLKWAANGELPILIGTHALIQKSVKFKNLALAIIDEQHRFGTKQRASLVRKDANAPHLLSMTATPIPRTLALTIYGDLDLTLLDEMPPGRKPIITNIVRNSERAKVYADVRRELQNGRQLYVICPRIDEPDPSKEMALQAKSAKEEAKRLKKEVFPEYEISVLHSKMLPKEKDEVMADFAAGKIDILVATSVVEVGVNVPNATVMIIEGAERFGLAQLHQLRGRVVRSTHQAYCYVCTSSKNATSSERLKALVKAKNGFELAELDLALRGPGELSGTKQWGISDLGMEAIKNIKMVEAARTEAQLLLLKNHALAESKSHQVHFE